MRYRPGNPKNLAKYCCIWAITCVLSWTPAGHTYAQQSAPDGPTGQNPDRRRIEQLIHELESNGTEDRPTEAAQAFDLAWELAVRGEDPLLSDRPGTSRTLSAGKHQLDAGARARLQRIFERSSLVFRKAYEDFAESNLPESTEVSDLRELSKTVLRYQFTTAGRKALRNLIQLYASRGETLEAAIQTSRLLRLRGDSSDDSRFRLARLWWRAGLTHEALDTLIGSPDNSPPTTINHNGKELAVPQNREQLRTWFTELLGPSNDASLAWTQPRGNHRRTKLQPHGPSSLTALWNASSFEYEECVECLDDEEINNLLQPIAEPILDAFRAQALANRTLAPVGQPVVVGEKVVYRGVAKIRCVEKNSGELLWETTLIDRHINAAIESWRSSTAGDKNSFRRAQSHLAKDLLIDLLDHWSRAEIGGQLTTDGKYVFAIEDSTPVTTRRRARLQQSASYTNYLRIYDLETGLLKGQAGGAIGAAGSGGKANPLAGMYFLGAPLVLGEQIFLLGENNQGIFLVKLRLVPLFDDDGQIDIRPTHVQLLSNPQFALPAHPLRRFLGTVPSFSQGLLICQTCDERIVAVAAHDQSIRWIYRYPGNVFPSELTRQPVVGNAYNDSGSDENDRRSRWIDSSIRINQSQIFLTPRDSDRLICLDLMSGAEIWSVPRSDMRQLIAVTDDRLLLSGIRHVEAVSPATGERMWRLDLDSERICGRGICSGDVIQVPTTKPSIVSIEAKTGRLLVTQKTGETLPGNLFSDGQLLLSQNIAELTAYGAGNTGQASPLAEVRSLLMGSDVSQAEKRLQTLVADSSDETISAEATEMLSDLLLESIRLDFDANSDRIPELRSLMATTSYTEDDLTRLVATMIGMSPGDASRLHADWKQVNQRQEKRNRLNALIAQRSFRINQKSARETADKMMSLLDQTRKQSVKVTSPAVTTAARLAKATVARSLRDQPADVRAQIQNRLSKELSDRIRSAETPKEAFDWWQTILLCDLHQTAGDLASESEIELPKGISEAIKEVSLLRHSEMNESALGDLWNYWATHQPASVVSSATRSTMRQRSIANNKIEAIPGRLSLAHHSATSSRSAVTEWRKILFRAMDRIRPNPWSGTPKVTATNARVGQSPAPLMMNSPGRNIPIFNSSGIFANWSLTQRPTSHIIYAHDERGHLRWKFQPDRKRGRVEVITAQLSRYAIGYGHLLLVRLGDDIVMLNCLQATEQAPPTALWKINISTDVGNPTESQARSPAFLGVTQYDIQPPGLFPVAEITPYGVPVFSAQRLKLLNTFTGETEWEIDGLPEDCVLTCDGDNVLLISKNSGTVQSHSLLDGRVTGSVPAPDWWSDANENTSASIYELELNPGDTERWRLTVCNGQCLLLARTTEESALELHELATGRLVWRYELSQDSVVSNIVDNHVAILSDSSLLQVIDLAAGAMFCQHRMPEAKRSRHLFLRRSGDRWVVLTSTEDTDYWEQNPVNDSEQLNGWACGIHSETGKLVWTKTLEYEWIRILCPHQAVMPAVAPLVVLMKRPSTGPRIGGTRYRTRILDVNSGNEIYKDDSLGLDLSYHCMNLDPDKRRITIGFGIRDVIFDYTGTPESDPQAPDIKP